MFPEFAKIVGTVHNNYVYELLTNDPTPQKIKRVHFDSLLKIKRLTAIKAREIQVAAQFTIGSPSPAKLQTFAGLEPSIYQSGQMDNSDCMVKRGSYYLRYAFIQASKLICVYSPHFHLTLP